jgi:hypothetical protein
MVVELVAAGAVFVLLCLIARSVWMRWRRPEQEACVTEEEAREHAAPLTTAILSGSRRKRSGS